MGVKVVVLFDKMSDPLFSFSFPVSNQVVFFYNNDHNDSPILDVVFVIKADFIFLKYWCFGVASSLPSQSVSIWQVGNVTQKSTFLTNSTFEQGVSL